MPFFLCCCGVEKKQDAVSNDYDWLSDASPISPKRTGILEQGISSYGVECTEDGVYFILNTNNGNFLFYGDHGSDSIVKLCSRPECSHADKECNAFLGVGSSNICYYNGNLYMVQFMENQEPHVEVVKFNLDGTGRVPVMNTLSLGNQYSGNSCWQIWNGVFSIVMTYIDESGNECGDHYYYKLDGSMKQIEPCSMWFPRANDGEFFLNYITADDGTQNIYYWDPDTNKNTYLENVKEISSGYTGVEWSYKIQDGIFYRYNELAQKEEALFDTGLDGEKAVSCFPDCIVIRDHISWDSYLSGETLEKLNLYFYNWDYEFLGSVALDYPRAAEDFIIPICAETPERIILTDSYNLYPRYYIEKSDFGTGNIDIHAYNLPDLTAELANLDQELAGN